MQFPRIYHLIIGLLFVQACTTSPIFYNQTGTIGFSRKLSNLLQQSNLNANIGIEIKSIETGKTLFGLNKDQLLTPASNVKIFTTAAALNKLGPEYQFSTFITNRGNNLCIQGMGDPSFTLSHLDSLTDLIATRFNSIDTLFLDDSYFENLQYGNGWMWDEGSWAYSAPIGALSINENCIDFITSPNSIGKPVRIHPEPNTDYITILNESIMVNDSVNYVPFKIERDWMSQTNVFKISGELLLGSIRDTIRQNIYDPTLFTGTLFKEMLHNKGVKIHQLKKGQLSESELLYEHQSDSLSQIISFMMKESHNLTAEAILKTIGKSENEVGRAEDGIKYLKTFLATLQYDSKIDTSNIRIVDGSGLSRYNLVSPAQVVTILCEMYNHQFSQYFIKSFPHGGQEETTLENRLKNEGMKIIAKTGSISGVSTLSGYAISPKHGPLAFSIMMNGFVGTSAPYKKLQDQICQFLVN